MTIKEFVESSDFHADEVCFDISSDYIIKYNLTKQELIPYYNEKIEGLDFFAAGNNSGESYLTITFYI